eukprot:TRINITY_DN22200_c0_g1_i4.p1 TRINITY_DN22200_c0_g1~~TRINITY_DN22200_c0_g1_i4.p1  ORF type:complete len:381 (+),score=29.56 TRINITY_DN22200_c0_g1_i4:56-1144(+)
MGCRSAPSLRRFNAGAHTAVCLACSKTRGSELATVLFVWLLVHYSAAASTRPSFSACEVPTAAFSVSGTFPDAGTLTSKVQDAPCPKWTDSAADAGNGRTLFACLKDGAVLCNGDGSSGANPAVPAVCRSVGLLGCPQIVEDMYLSADRRTIYAGCQTEFRFCQWDDAAGAAIGCAVLTPGTDCSVPTGVAVVSSATLVLGCYSTKTESTSGILVCPLAAGGALSGPCAKRGENPCGASAAVFAANTNAHIDSHGFPIFYTFASADNVTIDCTGHPNHGTHSHTDERAFEPTYWSTYLQAYHKTDGVAYRGTAAGAISRSDSTAAQLIIPAYGGAQDREAFPAASGSCQHLCLSVGRRGVPR